jgi:DNA-binding MarR family transcriptional regulator
LNTHLLIDAVVQQTMVFIAQLATSGGVRAPLAHVADQVFLDLSRELQNQGVTKKVIADMFGMALRTYHRRVQETMQSRTDAGRTVWEAVLEFIRESEPVSGSQVQLRFVHDDAEVVSGVLHDLVNSGLAFRSGRGDGAVYRAAAEADFAAANGSQSEAAEWLVWLTVYRKESATLAELAETTRLPISTCEAALSVLVEQGRATKSNDAQPVYRSERFEVPLGESHGWEAAVLDHYQAMTSAICAKLAERGAGARAKDVTGGSTWSLDVWAGHPLEEEATQTLARMREQMEALRARIDHHNESAGADAARQRVVVYVGQYVRGQ